MNYFLDQEYFTNPPNAQSGSSSPQQPTNNMPNTSTQQPQTSMTMTPTQTPSPPPTLKQGLASGLNTFFNYKTGTILTFAICFCLGGAFKDLIQNMVNDIVEPSIVKLLMITNVYDISWISDILKNKHSDFNISSAISSFVSFLIILFTVYFIFILLTNTFVQP